MEVADVLHKFRLGKVLTLAGLKKIKTHDWAERSR